MMKKTVIVTGASSGIGKAIAKRFLANGDNVVMNSLNKRNLENAFEELGSPDNAKMAVVDISKKEAGKLLTEAAIKNFQSLDVLVNNAGMFSPKPFLVVEEGDLDRFLNVNLKGAFFISQAVVAEMLERGGGSIINIGTTLVDHAMGGFPATAPVVSKAGLHALTRQLAAEFGKQNIRVNTIAPGVIRSPLLKKVGTENEDRLAGLHLLNKIGEVEDVAEVAYALAINTFISGEIIHVDGGYAAGHHVK